MEQLRSHAEAAGRDPAGLQVLLRVNVDVAWLLTVGEKMLDGQRLYVDILETNPPNEKQIPPTYAANPPSAKYRSRAYINTAPRKWVKTNHR